MKKKIITFFFSFLEFITKKETNTTTINDISALAYIFAPQLLFFSIIYNQRGGDNPNFYVLLGFPIDPWIFLT